MLSELGDCGEGPKILEPPRDYMLSGQMEVELCRYKQSSVLVGRKEGVKNGCGHKLGNGSPVAGHRFADAAHHWRARSESRSEAKWLSASILHDLRNPVGTIYAGAEMLMTLDTAPNQVKRLAANIHRAAGRMWELLIDLAGATYGNRSTPEICDIREIIAAASEAAAAAMDNQRVQILLDVPGKIELPLARSRMKLMFFNLITNALEAMPGGGEVRIGATRYRDYVLVAIEDTGP
jgi:signal transduction histidine kinase